MDVRVVQVAIATLMTSLTIVLAATWRRRSVDLLAAAILISIAEFINVNEIYLVLDSILWGRNFVDLGANLLLILGISVLSLATIRVVRGPSYQPKIPFIMMGLTMAAMLAAFFQLPTVKTTTAFMADHGNRLPAAAYNLAEFCFIGYVMLLTGWVIYTQLNQLPRRSPRLGGGLFVAGCAVITLNVLNVIMMDLAHLSDTGLLQFGQTLYGPIDLLGMILLCSGAILMSFARTPEVETDRLAELEPQIRMLLKRGKSMRITERLWNPPLKYRMRKNLTDVYDKVGAGSLTLSDTETALVDEVDTLLTASSR